jgi:anthraniloyl-CoA monooxygenase
LTRSQRISHENLRERDPEWLNQAEKWFQSRAGVKNNEKVRAPMFAPFKLRELELKNRIVVSPMAQYKAINGCPTDWHFVHYAERAKGGAGLIYVEMTCISPEGRITPGCTGLYSQEHEFSWKRIIDFIHVETEAKISCQIGHSGRKGSTQLGWEKMDAPLKNGNWPIISASSIPWSKNNAVPVEMTELKMEEVLKQFVSSTEMANRAGFDMIELHAAHGYLISSFISPKSNIRKDKYGGSLDNRMRYPLRVAEAMRKSWPKEKPMSVRISANDWVGEEGITPQESVKIAKMFKAIGIDIIDVSAGQTSDEAKPVYGRMFQTPFSDRIRNEAGINTMAVGNIYEADHVNSILMAGRADLVCIARPHLSNPYWTLHAGTSIGDRSEKWLKPYEAGRDQMWRLSDRDNEINKDGK